MTDETVIIEGNVKFHEGKKWKPRWCVLRKLSPVADCVQLEVFAEGGGGAAREVIPLRPYAGYEAGRGVGGEAHTLAVLLSERVLLLATVGLDDWQRWTDALRDHVGQTERFRVVVPGAGPGRVLVVAGRVSLVTGAPHALPRLVGSWCLRSVRRFGAVHGRFALEAGESAGGGAGVTAVLTDCAQDISRAVARAAAAARVVDGRSEVRRLERCASCVSRLDGFAPAWTMDRTAADADAHYDVPRNTLEFDGEYYDTPRRMHDYLKEESFRMPKSCTVDALTQRVDDWLRPRVDWTPAERSSALYATVNVRRKARASSETRVYENTSVLRSCGDHYLPMCPAGYAAMMPARPADVALTASPPRRSPQPNDRHSQGSNDSGVWSCAPIRPLAPPRGVADSRSTSSGTSDMSDYMETLSLSSDPSWESPRPP